MAVAVARRRIGAHHVDVAPPGGIPQMRALPARQHDGKRRVIIGAVAPLELDGVHGTSPHCRGRITARIAIHIYVVAAARAAEVDARRGGFGGGGGAARPKRRFVNPCAVSVKGQLAIKSSAKEPVRKLASQARCSLLRPLPLRSRADDFPRWKLIDLAS